MPEGDSVASSAQRIATVIFASPLLAAVSRWPGKVQGLVGQRVRQLRCRGKHLLMDVEDGTTVRVHLRMSGRWTLSDDHQGFGEQGRVAIGLRTRAGQAVCHDAPELERLRPGAEPLHPVLARLGPDLIGLTVTPAGPQPLPPPPVAEAAARARHTPGDRPLHVVLLDQRVAAGLGNVYANELPFVLRVPPLTPIGHLSDAQLTRAYDLGARWLRANMVRGPRTTVREASPGSLWVVRRQGRPCRRCGTRVVRGRSPPPHDRPLWWCPRCQPDG